jgi:hypothetical protein
MALVVFDRVQETTATTGTGTITLGGAVTGYQSFAVVGDGNTTFYCITNNAQWEVGIGTYTSSGTTLSRDTVLSNSNGNTSPITLSGSSVVFVTYPAEKSVNLNASGNVTALGTVSSGTWQGTTIGVAYGGTGVTSSSGANSVVLRDSNANVIFNNFIAGFTAVTAAAGTTVLTVASTRTQVLIGSTTQTIQLPDATTLQLGHSFIFVNNSSGVLTITNNASATIDLVPSGGAVQLGATSIATVAGTWGIYSFLPGTYNFSIPTADFGTATITNATWQGGTIQPAYGGTGLTTFAAADNALYSTGASTLTAGTLPVAAGGTGATSLSGANIAVTNATNTFTANQVVSVTDNTNAALRITQLGTGNALLVEDSANPDASPVVIDSIGVLMVGATTSSVPVSGGAALQTNGTGNGGATLGAFQWNAGANPATSLGGQLALVRSKSATVGTNALVASGDTIGSIFMEAADGSSFVRAAAIQAYVDGAPGTDDMPGRLVFSTTPDGSATPTERMRINSSGFVTIGGAENQTIISASNYLQVQQTASGYAYTAVRYTADNNPATFLLSKSRGSSVGSLTAVQNGDSIGILLFAASDGTTFIRSAIIDAQVDGTPGTDDMPGRLVFSTTAGGSDTPTERMRITSAGEVLVGGTTSLSGTGTGAVSIQRTGTNPQLNLYRNDTSVAATNSLGSINFWGNDTTSNTPTQLAYMEALASGTHAAGDNPTDIVFATTPDGTETAEEAVRISDAGNLLVGTTATFSSAPSGNLLLATGYRISSANAGRNQVYVGTATALTATTGTLTFNFGSLTPTANRACFLKISVSLRANNATPSNSPAAEYLFQLFHTNGGVVSLNNATTAFQYTFVYATHVAFTNLGSGNCNIVFTNPVAFAQTPAYKVEILDSTGVFYLNSVTGA